MNELTRQRIEQKIKYRKRNLPSFIQDFLDSLSYDHAIQTQWEYAKDIHLFFEFLIEKEMVNKTHASQITLQDLASLTEKDIRSFLDYLTCYKKEFLSVGGNPTVQEFRNGPRGKERKRATLNVLYDYFIEREQLVKNPAARIKIKVEKHSIKPRLTSPEMYRMFEVVLDHNPHPFRAFRNYVILKILGYTGIRISELTNMDIGDVWVKRNEMVVTRKGGEKDVIYINTNIREDLYQYLEERKAIKHVKKGHQEALFLSQQKRRLDPKSVRKMIRLASQKAGVDIPVTPHTFRRTFGWNHYNQNKDLALTANILGHSSPETTRKSYANADEERMNQSLDRFAY